jgi:hypothetical protein
MTDTERIAALESELDLIRREHDSLLKVYTEVRGDRAKLENDAELTKQAIDERVGELSRRLDGIAGGSEALPGITSKQFAQVVAEFVASAEHRMLLQIAKQLNIAELFVERVRIIEERARIVESILGFEVRERQSAGVGIEQ